METILIQTENQEQSAAIKAVLKALKVNFTAKGKAVSKDDMDEMLNIAASIKKGFQESQDIESDKIKPQSIKQLLDEL